MSNAIDYGYMIDESLESPNQDYKSIHKLKEFDEATKEYFDITDNNTRKAFLYLNEAQQSNVLQGLAGKLYKQIVDNVDDIDFGTIPLSKGDITKIQNYTNLKDCITIISDILRNYKQSTEAIDIVDIAVRNLESRINLFTRAYKLNVEAPIITYNTMALAVVSGVSLMIASCIEFIKLPDDKGFEIAVNKAGKINTKNDVLYSNLTLFNKMCSNGTLDKCMNTIMDANIKAHKEAFVDINVGKAADEVFGKDSNGRKAVQWAQDLASKTKNMANKYPLVTGAVLGVAGIAGIIFVGIQLIKGIRALIWKFYYTKAKLSDYYDTQSALLKMNAYNVENDLTRDPVQRTLIAKKQMEIAERYKKIANKLNVENKTSDKKAIEQVKKHDKDKYTYKDIMDSIPNKDNNSNLPSIAEDEPLF